MIDTNDIQFIKKESLYHPVPAPLTARINSTGNKLIFSPSLVRLEGWAVGDHISVGHKDYKYWYFVKSNEAEDTFMLIRYSGASNGLSICNKILLRLFMDKTHLKPKDSMYVQDTGSRLNNNAVYEILCDKSRTDILKKK